MVKKHVAILTAASVAVLIMITGCGGTGNAPETGSSGALLADRSGPAFEMNERLGRGVNLSASGQLDIRAEDFKIIKDAGFDSIRMPVRWSAHSLEDSPYTIEPAWFDRVDWAIEQALKQDLPIVLDFHYYPLISFVGREETTETLEHNLERFLALWTQIAEHYKDFPPEVLFEILNEPSNYLGPDRWNKLFNEALTIIRRTNPHQNRCYRAGMLAENVCTR